MSDTAQPNITTQVTDPQVITAPLNLPVSLARLLQSIGAPGPADLAALQSQITALDARVTALEAAATGGTTA